VNAPADEGVDGRANKNEGLPPSRIFVDRRIVMLA